MKKLSLLTVMFVFCFANLTAFNAVADHPTEHPTKAKKKSFFDNFKPEHPDKEEVEADLEKKADELKEDAHSDHPTGEHPF